LEFLVKNGQKSDPGPGPEGAKSGQIKTCEKKSEIFVLFGPEKIVKFSGKKWVFRHFPLKTGLEVLKSWSWNTSFWANSCFGGESQNQDLQNVQISKIKV